MIINRNALLGELFLRECDFTMLKEVFDPVDDITALEVIWVYNLTEDNGASESECETLTFYSGLRWANRLSLIDNESLDESLKPLIDEMSIRVITEELCAEIFGELEDATALQAIWIFERHQHHHLCSKEESSNLWRYRTYREGQYLGFVPPEMSFDHFQDRCFPLIFRFADGIDE